MKRFAWLISCLCMAACGSDNDSGNSSTSSSDQAAQAAAESADSAGSGGGAVAGEGTQGLKSTAFHTTFDLYGCTCAVDGNVSVVAGDVSLDANFSVDPATCTLGRSFSGAESVSAKITSANRVVDVVADMNMTLRSGDVVTITTLAAGAPTYSGTGTGDPSDGATTFTASINEHRQRYAYDHTAVYDMNISTPTSAPAVLTDVYSQSVIQTRTTNGTVTVHHNLEKYTATHTFTDVQRSFSDCNCPSSGQITQQVTLDSDNTAAPGSFTKVFVFTGCGTGTFKIQSSTTGAASTTGASSAGSFAWDSCS